jgi:hypothetical protein
VSIYLSKAPPAGPITSEMQSRRGESKRKALDWREYHSISIQVKVVERTESTPNPNPNILHA